VARLSSTLKQFEAERSLLAAELSVLKALERKQQQAGSVARAAAVAEGVWGSLEELVSEPVALRRLQWGDQAEVGKVSPCLPPPAGSAGGGPLAADLELSPAGITTGIAPDPGAAGGALGCPQSSTDHRADRPAATAAAAAGSQRQ